MSTNTTSKLDKYIPKRDDSIYDEIHNAFNFKPIIKDGKYTDLFGTIDGEGRDNKTKKESKAREMVIIPIFEDGIEVSHTAIAIDRWREEVTCMELPYAQWSDVAGFLKANKNIHSVTGYRTGIFKYGNNDTLDVERQRLIEF